MNPTRDECKKIEGNWYRYESDFSNSIFHYHQSGERLYQADEYHDSDGSVLFVCADCGEEERIE